LVILFGAIMIAMSPAADTVAQPVALANDCTVISCTVLLPIILNPVSPPPIQLEVTQGVQQLDNSVRLIANRRTFARWMLTSDVAYTNVNAYLSATRNGIALSGSPLAALNNSRTLKSTAIRAVLDDTFNFQLPADWTAADVVLRAQASNSTGFFTYTGSAAFHFTPSVAMQVKVVPIAYHCTSGGSGTVTPAAPYDYLIDYTYRAYPVPSIGLSTHSAVSYSGPCTSSLPNPGISDWENVLDAVTNVWLTEGRPNVYYYGLLKIYCGSSCIAGLGWLGYYQVAIGFDGFGTAHSGASETHAHEVGHNHGRDHAAGCGADGPDPSFPYVYPDGRAHIGNDAYQNYGFNINSPAIYTYPSYYELMSYCSPEWISDYTYNGIWTYDNVVLARRSTQPTSNHAFLISGSIDPHADRIGFNPVYALDTPAYQPEGDDYVLEMLNANRQVVASYPFAAAQAQPDRWSTPNQAEEAIGFHLAVPYHADVATLRVRHGDTVLGTLDGNTSAPQLTAPATRFGISRSNQVTWSGSSTTGEPLSYLVRVSTDSGQTWETIAVDLPTPAITLNSTDFGGKVVWLQVIGSTGLKSSMLFLGPYLVPKE
jgi:hypothetical protein